MKMRNKPWNVVSAVKAESNAMKHASVRGTATPRWDALPVEFENPRKHRENA